MDSLIFQETAWAFLAPPIRNPFTAGDGLFENEGKNAEILGKFHRFELCHGDKGSADFELGIIKVHS